MRIALALLMLAACHGGGAPPGAPLDATAADDAAASDAAPVITIDAATIDAAMIDAAMIDAAVIDARPPPDAAPPPPSDAPPQPPGLALVSARDHIDDHFLVPRLVTADATRIYVAGVVTTGTCQLFVLGRERAADFPLLQTITLPSCGIGVASVENDATSVRVATTDGMVHVYTKGAALALASSYTLTSYSADSVWSGGDVVVSETSGTVAATSTRVFVHTLNTGDHAQAFALPAFAPGTTYAPPFDITRIAAFDRATGAMVGSLPAIPDNRGIAGAVSIDASGGSLAEFVGGCCGDHVELYDPITLARTASVYFPTDSVTWSGPYLVLGSESGVVSMWDLRGPYPLVVGWADLRQLTGHTRLDDIEIRALYSDNRDQLIFAASSWNYPDVPSFFVLERTGD